MRLDIECKTTWSYVLLTLRRYMSLIRQCASATHLADSCTVAAINCKDLYDTAASAMCVATGISWA